ncbi:hypothetical protein [Deinococcus maricopensis]|uniref:hypothetical protein n=1 Tax=Deinococcus maricopensis TaxID=309887 RepID=UPI0011D24948|nr:hypothetical protein [Deinococcus maricopensis]
MTKLDRVLPVRINRHMDDALELLSRKSGFSKSATVRWCTAMFIDYLAIKGEFDVIPTYSGYQRFLRHCEEDDS